MKTLTTLVTVATLICGLAFATNQTSVQTSSADTKQFRGEVEKIDLKAKTITLRIKSASTVTSTPNVAQTSTTATEPQTQTSTGTKDQLQIFKFTEVTTLAALEAEETPTTMKMDDLDKGDEIIVHVDVEGLIQKIEIVDD